MDILFAFDTTSNANLERQKQIAKAVIAPLLPLNKLTGTRIGAVSYNRIPRSLFSYNRYAFQSLSNLLSDMVS